MTRYIDISGIKWVGTPPPSGQGTFAIVDGKRIGGVLPSALHGQSQQKPFSAHYGEYLEFGDYFKTLDEAKTAIVNHRLRGR